MSGKITWRVMFIYVGIILFGIVVGTFSASQGDGLWRTDGLVDVAQAAESIATGEQYISSPLATHQCNSFLVGTFTDKVNLYCNNPAPGGVTDFSVSTSDFRHANRVLSIMLTADSLGKTLFIYYDLNGDGSAYSCPPPSCRPIQGIELYFLP